VTHPQALIQAEAVHNTLEDIEADGIPSIPVLNKIDRLRNPDGAQTALETYPNAVAISALKGDGIDDLLQTIKSRLYESYEPIQVEIPYNLGSLISLFHEEGQVDQVENRYEGVFIQGRLPVRYLTKYKPYLVDGFVPN